MTARTINPSSVIRNPDGSEMIKILVRGEEPSPITLRRLIQFVFDQPIEGDQAVGYKDKWLWAKLSDRAEQDECVFNAKETDIILTRASKLFSPLIVGRMKDALDPEPEPAQRVQNGKDAEAPAAPGKEAPPSG